MYQATVKLSLPLNKPKIMKILQTLQTPMKLMIKLMTKATQKITHKANASNIDLKKVMVTIEEIETIATVGTAKEATTTTATTTTEMVVTAVTVADIKSPGTTIEVIVVIVAIADMAAMTAVAISIEIEATTSTIVATVVTVGTNIIGEASPMRSLTKTQSIQIQTTGCTIRMPPTSSARHSHWRRVHSTLRFTCSKVIRLVKKTEKWVQTYLVAAKSARICRISWPVFRRWMWT